MPSASSSEVVRLSLDSAAYPGNTPLARQLVIDSRGHITRDLDSHHGGHRVGDVIVLPGVINSHDHLEFNLYPRIGRPPYVDIDEWSRDVHEGHARMIADIESVPFDVRRYWGVLKNLSWGVTTVMNHGDSGRNPSCDLPVRIVSADRYVHRADVRWAWLPVLLRKAQGRLVFHVAEGTSDQVARLSSAFLKRLRWHGPLIGVHGICLTASDARHLEALVWCPVSNLFLFERTADISSLKPNTAILFGTDTTMSADGSIWDHLRVARQCGGLSDDELLASVTATAARIWGVDNRGDMVLLRRSGSDPWESLFAVQPEDVVAVIVKNRLALLSEELFERVAPESWQALYASVTIGDNNVRIYCPSRGLLEALAAVDDSPVMLN